MVRENGDITVTMKDGREFTGTLQSVDRVTDLATLRIDAVSAVEKIQFIFKK